MLIALTLAAFWPCRNAGFVNCDDDKLVYANPAVRALSPAQIGRFFMSSAGMLYQPLVMCSYAVEYRSGGLNPKLFHATNMLLHACSVVLVMFLCMELGLSPWGAALVALCFSLSPARAQSVAWVSERKDVLYLPFFLGALIAYLRYCHSGVKRLLWYSFGLFLFALLAKPAAFVLPIVLLAADYLHGRLTFAALREKIPFWLVMAVALILSKKPVLDVQLMPVSWIERLLNASYAGMYYLAQCVWPSGMMALHPFLVWHGHIPLKVLCAPAILLVVVALFILLRKNRQIVFGGMFFGITIFPAIMVPLTWIPFISDNYTYAASIGIYFACAAAFESAVRRPAVRVICAGATVVVLAVWAVLTWQRCGVWRDSISVWSADIDALSVGKSDQEVAGSREGMCWLLLRRAEAYRSAGRPDLAEKDCRWLIRIWPEHEGAYLTLSDMSRQKGDTAAAIGWIDSLLAIVPGSGLGHFMKAETYVGRHDTGAALEEYRAATRYAPGLAQAHFRLAQLTQLSSSAGSPAAVLSELDAAIAADPRHIDALFARANLRAQAKEYAAAIQDFSRILAMNPREHQALLNRGLCHYYSGNAAAAAADLRAVRENGGTVPAEIEALLRR